MLPELLCAASIAVGSMAAKTVAPPKPGVVTREKLAFGRIAELLDGIAARLREASSVDDVPWLLSSKVFDPDFLELIDEAEVLLASADLGDLVDHADAGLPSELREVGALMRVAFQVAHALRAREAELEVTETERPRIDPDDTDAERPRQPTVEELASSEALPRRVREAIYGGYASAVCTIALLDPRPMPPWLRAELLRRAVEGQAASLRLLLALARQAGVAIPRSPIADAIAPLDLHAAELEHQRERAAFERGLARAQALRNA